MDCSVWKNPALRKTDGFGIIKEPLIESGASRLRRKASGSRRELHVKPAIAKIHNTEAGDPVPQDARMPCHDSIRGFLDTLDI